MTLQTPNPPLSNDVWVETAPPTSPTSHRTLWGILGIVVAGMVVYAAAAGSLVIRAADEPTVVNTHTAQSGEPALISVPGYTYEDPATFDDADLTAGAASMEQALVTANAEAAAQVPDLTGGFYLSWSMHGVTSDGTTPDAVLVLASVNPEVFTLDPALTPDDIVGGLAGGMATGGGTVHTETIAGENVVVATDSDGTVFAWYHDGVMSMALGSEMATVRDFVTAYLTEAHK